MDETAILSKRIAELERENERLEKEVRDLKEDNKRLKEYINKEGRI